MAHQTWKMPDPPDTGVRAVRDVDCTEWTRVAEDGEFWRSPGRGVVSWHRLVWDMGPITAELAVQAKGE
jgi:hypothetical protein